jgi:hypothetical protein
MSEGNIPIDIAGVKNIHFECTFHSRFTRTDPGPPAIYAIVFPGTFRQSVCSSSYKVGEKFGVVQYCSFRQVPDQMEKMIGLFNVCSPCYLLPSSAHFSCSGICRP